MKNISTLALFLMIGGLCLTGFRLYPVVSTDKDDNTDFTKYKTYVFIAVIVITIKGNEYHKVYNYNGLGK